MHTTPPSNNATLSAGTAPDRQATPPTAMMDDSQSAAGSFGSASHHEAIVAPPSSSAESAPTTNAVTASSCAEGTETRTLNLKALYVTGLSLNADFIDLHKHFDRFGEIVLCRVLKDAKTGVSRGIGYVNYDSEAEAAAAQAATDGQPGPRDEPSISVKFAEADPTYRAVATTKVFVRYVPPHITTTDVRNAFSKYGKVLDVTIEADRSRVVKRGPCAWNYAYVVYPTTKEANFAIANATKDINWGPQPIVTKPAETEEARVARGTASKKPGNATPSGGALSHASTRPALPTTNRVFQPPPAQMLHHHHHHHAFMPPQTFMGAGAMPFMPAPMGMWPGAHMQHQQQLMMPMYPQHQHQHQQMMVPVPMPPQHAGMMPMNAFQPGMLPQPFMDPSSGMMMVPLDPAAQAAWGGNAASQPMPPGGYIVMQHPPAQ